jgi:nicotinamidase-related amidase
MKRALIVVDMIEDFVHEGGALYCGPSMAQIVPVIQKEIARARAASEPVVYLTDNHLPGDAEFQMSRRMRSPGRKAPRSCLSSRR